MGSLCYYLWYSDWNIPKITKWYSILEPEWENANMWIWMRWSNNCRNILTTKHYKQNMGKHVFFCRIQFWCHNHVLNTSTDFCHADFETANGPRELIFHLHRQLDNICEDCYNLYKEADVHQFCRYVWHTWIHCMYKTKVCLKTSPDTHHNPRADCFSTSYFQRCLQVRFGCLLFEVKKQITSAHRPCSSRRIASSTWSRSSAARDSTLVPLVKTPAESWR